MTSPFPTSDESGELLDAGSTEKVTYVFADGHRRSASLTKEEADRLRSQGENRTSPWSRFVAWVDFKAVVKTLVIGALAVLIAQSVSDRYAEHDEEIKLESALLSDISAGAITVFQSAQDAARSGDLTERNEAADAWVAVNGTVEPALQFYYSDDSAVRKAWAAYQPVVYDWAVLGCCITDSDERRQKVQVIRDYLESSVGEPNRPAPVGDPWAALASPGGPDADTYQWVGLELMRGRGNVLDALRHSDPQL